MEDVNSMKIVKTPAAEYLFIVNPNPINLHVETAYVFHTKIDKSLFPVNRAKPDIQPTVPFLCTRVKGLDKYDWKQLLIMINYHQ